MCSVWGDMTFCLQSLCLPIWIKFGAIDLEPKLVAFFSFHLILWVEKWAPNNCCRDLLPWWISHLCPHVKGGLGWTYDSKNCWRPFILWVTCSLLLMLKNGFHGGSLGNSLLNTTRALAELLGKQTLTTKALPSMGSQLNTSLANMYQNTQEDTTATHQNTWNGSMKMWKGDETYMIRAFCCRQWRSHTNSLYRLLTQEAFFLKHMLLVWRPDQWKPNSQYKQIFRIDLWRISPTSEALVPSVKCLWEITWGFLNYRT